MISIVNYLFEITKEDEDKITGKHAVKIALKRAKEHVVRNKGKYALGAGALALARFTDFDKWDK